MKTKLEKGAEQIVTNDCNIGGFIKNMTRLENIIVDVNNGCVIFASYPGRERVNVTVQDASVFFFFYFFSINGT